MTILEVGKTYSITVPATSFGDVLFEETKSMFKVLDKKENLDRMTHYQLELALRDDYYCMEDIVGCLVLFKIKKDYEVEEV